MAVILGLRARGASVCAWVENFWRRFSSQPTCSVWEAHDRHEPKAQVSSVRRRARENAARALAAVGSHLQPPCVADPTASSFTSHGLMRPVATRRHRRRDLLRSGRRALPSRTSSRRRRSSSRPQFDEELRRVRATPPEQIRRDLQVTYEDELRRAQSLYRRPGSGIDQLVRLDQRLLGARARRPLAPAPASSSRAMSSTAPARSRPAAPWPCSRTSTSALRGRAAMS